MCGVVGYHGPKEAFPSLLLALSALQHRGQDGAGIATSDGRLHLRKGLGLTRDALGHEDAANLPGNLGIGHIRYATQGSNRVEDLQPAMAVFPFDIAMAHNGNVTNFSSLKQELNRSGGVLSGSNDVELILWVLSQELIKKKPLDELGADDLFDAVCRLQHKVEGAYAVVALLGAKRLLGFCDPKGVRPLLLGKREHAEGTEWLFASETCAFDHLGFELIETFSAGEMAYIDEQGKLHIRSSKDKSGAFCSFEYIYFSREDSLHHLRRVAGERVKMGRLLGETAKRRGLKPDVVIDVPASAYFAASGVAETLMVPYRRGLTRNSAVGRSFITSNELLRERLVRSKLNPIPEVVKHKSVAVVDDSIARGTTAKGIIKMLREVGAKEVHFLVAAPPIRFPCVYGIDLSTREEILASSRSVEEIKKAIDADSLTYLDLHDLRSLYSDMPCCFACFDGVYPAAISEKDFLAIEYDRQRSR